MHLLVLALRCATAATVRPLSELPAANDDEVLAFEWLDSARILYEKQAPSRERDVDLARVHMRLGDLFSEGEWWSS